MYERIKQMTKDEMRKFIYWVYMSGVKDGENGTYDSANGYFGGYIVDVPAEELIPNGLDELWATYTEGAV